MGDVVQAAPAFASLRRAFPGAWITLLTSPPTHEILKKTGWANEVFAFNKQALDQQPILIRWLKSFRLGLELRSRRFDLALDLYGSHRSAQLVKSSNATIQVGLDLPETRGFYHARAKASDRLTVSARELDTRVLRLVGVEPPDSELWPVPEQAGQYAAQFFSNNGFAEEDLVVAVNPFASCVTKEWHPRKWGEVVRELLTVGVKVFLTCAPLESKRLSEIEAETGMVLPSYSEAFLTPLLGLYQRCRVVISCDSGPRHLAAAVGTPTLTVWGPELPSRWHTYPQEKHPIVVKEVPCRPCGLSVCIEKNHECMVAIQPDEVIRELKKLLKQSKKVKTKGHQFDRTIE
jgi:ADP-heptose:LPS heptosyltransferase